MHKALLIIGTRPELIKVAPVIHEMKRRGHRRQLLVVNTGQHKELMGKTFRFLGIKPDYTLDVMVPGQSLNELMGRALQQLQQLVSFLDSQHQKPTLIMAQGDTATACAAALTAFHNKIPFAHIEAGLRTHDFENPFPEEYYRRVISLDAAKYFAPTSAAVKNLVQEGIPEEKIVMTGNTVVDALDFISRQNPPKRRKGHEPLPDLSQFQKNVLITCHRRENFGKNILNILNTVKELAEEFPSYRFLWLQHLNPSVRKVVQESGLNASANVDFIEPLDYLDLVRLYPKINIIVTDSGGIQEEAPSFGIPVIVLRETTERMESVDNGFAFLCGADPIKIKSAFRNCALREINITHNPYGDGKSAMRITDCVEELLKPKVKKQVRSAHHRAAYSFKTLVIGSGPAGTGLLYNELRKNKLSELMSQGICFLEKSETFGAGSIGKYIINSDTAGNVFLESLPLLQGLPSSLRLHTLSKLISEKYGSRSVPLEWVGNYLKEAGKALKHLFHESESSRIFTRAEAVAINRGSRNNYYTTVRRVIDGVTEEFVIKSQSVVFAMGGRQEQETILRSVLKRDISLETYREKLMLTDYLFTRAGVKSLNETINQSGKRKIVVIGSSHSAFSSIWILLNKLKNTQFADGDITLLCRSNPKLFYPSKEEALAEGYEEFTERDICPVTNKVHRLAGLRLDSRDLLKSIRKMCGRQEARVTVKMIDALDESEIRKVLEDAAVIIPAFGYRAGTIPLFNESGKEIELSATKGGPLVNRYCQVMDVNGKPITGLFGIGLASGFVPWGKLGGEPGFTGQTNGLWLYQNGVGELILDQLLNKELPGFDQDSRTLS